MIHSLVSSSFVGVWKTPLTKLAILPKPFAMDLFGDPYTTDMGMTPDGFMIQQIGSGIVSRVVYGAQRISVTSPDPELTGDYFVRVFEQLDVILDGELRIGARGFNSEHEWSGLDTPAELWVAERFIVPALKGSTEGEVTGQSVRFAARFDTPRRVCQVTVEPRVNNPEALFVSVNDHREKGPGKPSSEEVSQGLDRSERLLHEHLFPRLGLVKEATDAGN